jgi:hypothetical protein
METDFDIYDKELLVILVSRIKKFHDKEWYSPVDAQPWVDSIDKTWNEYKARFETYKINYKEKDKNK